VGTTLIVMVECIFTNDYENLRVSCVGSLTEFDLRASGCDAKKSSINLGPKFVVFVRSGRSFEKIDAFLF
jgi:hypothetical protein